MASTALVKRIVFIFLTIALFVSSTYVFYSVQQHVDYVRNPNLKCSHPKEDMLQMLDLAFKIHTILDSFKIDHWLMYGSIFGAIRVQGPLPWDYDVDFGIRGEQFINIERSKFLRAFEDAGIQCENLLSRVGRLTLTKSGSDLGVDLYTFYDYSGIMKRPGWESWLLFIHYELHHSFPSRLAKSPLPKSRFGFFNISVPRGGNEVLKYLYRFDWWKAVKPLGCD